MVHTQLAWCSLYLSWKFLKLGNIFSNSPLLFLFCLQTQSVIEFLYSTGDNDYSPTKASARYSLIINNVSGHNQSNKWIYSDNPLIEFLARYIKRVKHAHIKKTSAHYAVRVINLKGSLKIPGPWEDGGRLSVQVWPRGGRRGGLCSVLQVLILAKL